MAKFAYRNQEQVIPTAEQNQAEFLALQKNSQRLIDLQTEEYINQKKAEQFGNFNALGRDPYEAVADEKYQAASPHNLNQNTNILPKANDSEDVDLAWAGQFQESFIKGVGETVIGSTGDVINLITAPLPDFSIAEGNVLGRALRE